MKKLNIGVDESETGEQAAGGFSLLSMFNRPEGQDEDASAEDGDQMDDGVSTVRKAPPQVESSFCLEVSKCLIDNESAIGRRARRS